MGFWGEVSGVNVHRRSFAWITSKKAGTSQEPQSRWFLSRFLSAAEKIVAAKGPAWSQGYLWGRPLGVWALLLLWIIPTVGLLIWALAGFMRSGMERPQPMTRAPRPRLVSPKELR